MSEQRKNTKSEHPRQRREQDTVHKMIKIYCSAQHQPVDGDLCEECQSLAIYTAERIEHCPFGYRKPTCANCSIHCYNPGNLEKIRIVMRYAGPRMLFRYPWLAIQHLLDGFHKPRLNN